MSASCLAAQLATTGAAGFDLQDATPTILTWTAPADGDLHVVTPTFLVHVTAAQTGGEIGVNVLDATGTQLVQSGMYPGGEGVGYYLPTQGGYGPAQAFVVPSGGTIELVQISAQTAGAANVLAALVGG